MFLYSKLLGNLCCCQNLLLAFAFCSWYISLKSFWMVWLSKTTHLFQAPLEACGVRLWANWMFYLGPFSAWIHLIRYLPFQALIFWRHPFFQGFACWRPLVINFFWKKKSSPHGRNLLCSFPPYPTEHHSSYSVQPLMHLVYIYKYICESSNPRTVIYITLLVKKKNSLQTTYAKLEVWKLKTVIFLCWQILGKKLVLGIFSSCT